MGALLNLILPLFATSKSYGEMLKKLAGFAFYETYLITFLLRDIPEIGAAFRSIETYGNIGAILSPIPNSAGLMLAVLVALFSHATQLHDRVSDLLGIRKRFDKRYILIPLAKLVGSKLTKRKLVAIDRERHSVMRAVFYRYASSRSDRPVVDKHDIEHALTAWSWLWALVEAAIYFSCGALVAIFFSDSKLATAFAIVVAALVALSFGQYSRLRRYAKPQIEAIASNRAAAKAVRAKFDAL